MVQFERPEFLDERYARAVMEECARRNRLNALYDKLVDDRFPEQKKFVLDTSRFTSACCTRRAGKTNGLGFKFFRAAIKYPKSLIPYVALTRDSAKNIMWPVLDEINDKYGIGAEMLESSLAVKLPNGSLIKLFGADMKNFIKRLRGIKTPFAGIDEAQSFGGHLEELVDDILTPAISDYEDGAIALTGTPGVIPKGYFHKASEGKMGYSAHGWSLYDNPYMPNPRKFVDDLKRKKGWTDENPTYLREWKGLWVLDLDALVYKFKEERNVYDALPAGHDYQRILSIDYGWNDQTAFGITAYSHTLKESFTEHIEGKSEMIPSQIAERINQLRDRFNPTVIIADTGGLGKTITEEMIRRYHIPIEAAEKREKQTIIHLMNGDFIDGRHKVHRSLTKLHEQYTALLKGEDGCEDPGLRNDLCDAALYGYRKAKAYLGELKEDKPGEGTKEHAEQIARELLEEQLRQFDEQQAKGWWEG